MIPTNTELLYGCIYTKAAKSPCHSFLLQFLTEVLRRGLRDGRLLRVEQPISCGDSEPEPDLAVVNGRNENFRHDHPHTAELVIEVCLTSHEYDRSKLPAYAAAGVKECWLVCAPEQRVEVYRQPEDGKFSEQSVHGPAGTLASVAVPEVVLALEELFAK